MLIPIISAKLKPVTICTLCGVFGFFLGASLVIFKYMNMSIPVWFPYLFVALTIAFSIAYWQALDETAKEAHKFSWYWGSTIGILIVLLFCFFSLAGLNSLHFFAWLLPENPTPDDIFFAGAYGVILTQIILYLIVWGFWWLRMR